MATRNTTRRLVSWCALTALFCAFASAVPHAREYRTAEFDQIKITIDSDWAPRSAPGYVPFRFDITNLSARARVIDLLGQGGRTFRSSRSSGPGSSVRQTVRLAAGDHVRLTIPVPVFADNESMGFLIREDSKILGSFGYGTFQGKAAPIDASVLFVANAGSAFATSAAKLVRTSAGRTIVASGGSVVITPPGVAAPGPPVDFLLDPDRLPANWIGFTSLRAIVIGSTEWTDLTDGRRAALLAWTAAGGDLVVVDGALDSVLAMLHGERAIDPDRITSRYFFGRVQTLSSAALAGGGFAQLLATDSRDARWALPANTALDWGTTESRGFRLTIPGIAGVPARAYLAILALFAVLIGPVNYLWLRRKRRLVLLVLTAPLISAAFIVLLTGYAIAGEGFGVQGRAVTFTMLDQSSKQSVTRASISLYAAGMAPTRGLGFGRDVAVFPLGQDGSGPRNSTSVDLTESQRFNDGWLQVRSATNLEQVTFRPARERLTFTREAQGLTVANGLDASVVMLLYREGDTIYRLNGALASGAKQTLSSAPFDGHTPVPAGASVPSQFLDLVQHLPAGAYLALLDKSPFWEPGVSGLVERSSAHVVLGWPEGQR